MSDTKKELKKMKDSRTAEEIMESTMKLWQREVLKSDKVGKDTFFLYRASKGYLAYCSFSSRGTARKGYRSANDTLTTRDYLRTVDSYNQRLKNEEIRKEAAKAELEEIRKSVKVGDIYYASWGYEQTNINFYQVLEVKGCFAIIREIYKAMVAGTEGRDCGKFIACPNDFKEDEEPMRKKIGFYGFKIDEVQSARKWNGNPLYCSWYY